MSAARRWRRLRSLALAVASLAFVLGFFTSTWVLALDRTVVERFEGRRFSVPSKVLSAPTILYPGLDWRRIELKETMLRLGYRERSSEPSRSEMPEGYFRWTPGRMRIHLRAFEHPSRAESSRDIVIHLRGSRIESIEDFASGRSIGAVLIEPELIGAYHGPDHEQRDLVLLSDVPEHLVQAIYAVEDQRFESHHGVDFRRILGAFLANVRAGGIRQGASTLTQQLVKNFFLTPERTIRRKAQEAVMALLVEARYDKQAILEGYLNEIYLGQRGSTAIHGVGEATRFYFGKSAQGLTLGESAVLAAIIQSPNRLSPHRYPDVVVERRDLVLELMLQQGRIDERSYQRAREEKLRVAALTSEPGDSRYFLDLLRRQLPEAYGAEVLSEQGLLIYSTLDPRLQRLAAIVLREGIEAVERARPELVSDDSERKLQGCIVALRPQTGEILALVGGRSYGESQFDRCSQARRPAGSVFKPFVYVAALEPNGGEPTITLASFLDDTPLVVDLPSGEWSPANYDHKFRGRVSVREALERSLNVPVARLGLELGPRRIAAVARRLGITSPLPLVPSLALGTGEVSPLEVARAYATLANGGIRPRPHTFEDVVASSETLERRTLAMERVIDAGTAYLATSLLEGVVDRGTAARVRAMGLHGPIAGKTGTTDDEHDLWFAGFTPELVVVVWLGFDEPWPIGVSSVRGPLPIWARFVEGAAGRDVRGFFLRPPEVEEIDIDPETGARAFRRCPRRRSELFLAGTEPEVSCPPGAGDAERDTGSFLDWLRGRR